VADCACEVKRRGARSRTYLTRLYALDFV
jgi:hypothetical protein